MHTVHGSAARIGGHRSEQSGVHNSKPHFFALHISARVQRASPLVGAGQKPIAFGLCPIGGRHTGEKQDGHGRPNRPAVALRTRHPT